MIERTDKALSSLAGMVIFKELFAKVLPDCLFTDNHLPSLKSGLKGSIVKFRQLVYGFQSGAECLDDMDKLSFDSAIKAINDDKNYGSKTFGNFLRSFNILHCKSLNSLLCQLSLTLRHQIVPDQKSITLDIDSTTNEQFGKKMEGVCANYAGIVGLSTIQVFDELGFQYWNDVRPGNTHTADGALEIIHRIFSSMPASLTKVTRYVRADSGYCKRSFFHACAAKNAQFVVCMRKLMYMPLVSKVTEWKAQDESDPTKIIFVGGRSCEVGETTYRPKNSHLTLRVVIIRALKPGSENRLLLTEQDYDYQGWVSSIDDSMSSADVIKFYRKRGHSENFIRELKNGLDMHHYPCQKLMANKAYGIIAAFAYNFMRFMALKDNPDNPQFSKAIRFKFVSIPCQVVRHARELVFRFMGFHFEEVRKWLMEIKKTVFSLPQEAVSTSG